MNISKANVEAIHELTPLQQSMFLQSATRQDLYHTQVVINLSGTIDTSRLENAWQTTVDQIDALRSIVLPRENKPPLQAVLRQVTPSFTCTTLQDDESLIVAIEDLLDTDRQQHFNLQLPPLSRVYIISTSAQTHAIIWSFAHIILDGWSSQFILSFWLKQYSGLTSKRPSNSFRHYQKTLNTYDYQQASAFWKSLSSDQNSRELPLYKIQDNTDRTPLQKEYTYKVDTTLIDKIYSSSRTAGVTPATLLLGVWALTCSRLTQHSNYIVGWGINGRQYPITDIYEMIGMLIQTIPLPIDCGSLLVTKIWLKELQKTHIKASLNAYLPLSTISKIIGCKVGESPFKCLLIFENAEIASDSTGEIIVESVDYIDRSELPLVITIRADQQLAIKVLYQTELYNEEIIESLLGYFQNAILNLCDNLETPVHSLSILNENQRQELIFSQSIHQNPTSRYSTITQWLKEASTEHHNRIAVEQGNHKTTYHTLFANAQRISNTLLSRKCGKVVAICMEPGANLVTTIIGILSINVAYVVIGVDHSEHIKKQYLDTLLQYEQRLILIKDTDKKIATETDSVIEVHIDDALSSSNDINNSQPFSVHNSSNTAYIIFTSGSTGKPKGIPITHKNLIESTSSRCRHYSNLPDRFLLLSPFHFDSVVAGLYWTLCNGGTLLIPQGDLAQNLDRLSNLIEQSKPTHTLCLPSVWNYILDNTDRHVLGNFKQVILAGEPLTADLAIKHHRKTNSVQLINEYGPTEATVWCVYHEIEKTFHQTDVPIGQPIDIASAYVVDPDNRLLPKGIAGELLIGGSGITPGYLNDSNNDRFITNLFRKNEVVYKSGDRVIWGEDDNLYILGRIDNQLKLRGVRFEAEAVEQALEELIYIDRAIVHIRKHNSDDNNYAKDSLVAVVCTSNKGITIKDIRRDLKERINKQLIPHELVVLDSLPLLSNGKIDRQACIELSVVSGAGSSQPLQQSEFNSSQAKFISKIWQQCTGSLPNSFSDNFFESGGDSLSAAQFISEINKQLKTSLSIADMYQDCSFSSLLNYVNEDKESENWSHLVTFNKHAMQKPLFFVYGNGQILSDALGSNHTIHWLIHGKAGTVVPHSSIETLAKEHVLQIIQLGLTEPIQLAGFSIGGIVAIEIARQLLNNNVNVLPVIIIDPTNPLNFLLRPRKHRVIACLTSRQSVNFKCHYLLHLILNSPKFIVERILRNHSNAPSKENNESIADQLPEMHQNQQLDRPTIINIVNITLSKYTYTPINHPIELIRSINNNKRLITNWMDEKIIWEEIAGTSINEQHIATSKRHDQLFKDAGAIADLSKILKKLLRTA